MKVSRMALALALLSSPMLSAFAQQKWHSGMDSSYVNPSVQYSARALAFTQHEGHGGSGSTVPTEPSDSSARFLVLRANGSQRAALAKCIEASKQSHIAIGRMGNVGDPWRRRRVSYDEQDLRTLARQEEQLQSLINRLADVHQAFWSALSEDQRNELECRLQRLDRLKGEIESGAIGTGQSLMDARTGPASPKIKWDVNPLLKVFGRLDSEHRKVAKQMGIPA